jgi:hypothetical protein
VIDVAGCNNQWVVSLHVSVSSKRSDAQKILSRINNGVAALRRSGELGAILAYCGVRDWTTVKLSRPGK